MLEDIVVTPHPNYPRADNYGSQDFDDQEDGREALLGSENRTRGIERIRPQSARVWTQVSGIVIESAPTLLLTTTGLLLTGELLDHVSRWRAMMTIDELIMIIPVILNLKGNLEMNLSARLGTAANMGELDEPQVRRKIILGNLALLQVQATVVAFVAACVSMLLGIFVPEPALAPVDTPSSIMNATLAFAIRAPRPHIPNPVRKPKSGFIEFIMVGSTAMLSACMSSILLGSFMCGLIIVCRHFGRDPDNIAPPIASCLGDLVTLCLLGVVSSVLITFVNTPFPLILAILLVLSATVCAMIVRRNPHVKNLITQGWSPLFGAMAISSATGIVLDVFATRFRGFPLLAIVISGLPGSVGSIFVSRLSTALHAAASMNNLSSQKQEPSARIVMITLLLITLPIEIGFLALLKAFGWLQLPIVFAVASVIFFCCAVSISLFLARLLTNFLWARDLDPDMYALPVHSAVMDLIGQLLLVLCFEIVSLLGTRLEN
ncbi:hypothetical protein BJ138DRAFT_1018075 [Hygrophoropsis aurantiaca]|uniref:Uncharacterized protein n=1 Tax=Hygrophoropsis aurantiaca TaxID=72124 RepID=A0ACB7ZXV8_9AGAM|nr:hypothetical protein BJ138DRAFT_1018075 [Hygrophoropsis aurantiaca]